MCIKIDSLANQNVSREGLTCEILARHSCLHLVLTLRIPACASHMGHFAGCLVTRYPRKLFSLLLLESSHSLFITQPLQSNLTINTGYKRMNRITIKFNTELKPTKQIVVNHNFTTCPFNKEWPNYPLDFQKYQNTLPNIQNYQNTPLISKKTSSLVHSTNVWYPRKSIHPLFIS